MLYLVDGAIELRHTVPSGYHNQRWNEAILPEVEVDSIAYCEVGGVAIEYITCHLGVDVTSKWSYQYMIGTQRKGVH